jgi:hypothetical protein
MDPKIFIQLLGTPADAPELKQLLATFGVTRSPKLDKGDFDANIEISRSGIEFIFTDEAFFRDQDDIAIGVSPLLLTNVSMSSDAAPGFSTYQGPLPYSLAFSDTRDAARAKLGPPDELDDDDDDDDDGEESRLDRWTKDGIWVFAEYADDFQSIVSVAVQLPDQD